MRVGPVNRDGKSSIDNNINILLHLICCFASLSMQCLLMVGLSSEICSTLFVAVHWDLYFILFCFLGEELRWYLY
jgi:hypothetical protein